MKALSLLLLRVSTGALLIIWGWLRVKDPATGIGLSERYYEKIGNSETIQLAMGWAEIGLGALVILGLLRIVVYPLQALVLLVGAGFIWKHIFDPFGVYLFAEGERANILFFPSLTVAAATLVLLAFRRDDAIALDRLFAR